MAQYQAADQAPNWSLPSTPYSVGTTIYYVCLGSGLHRQVKVFWHGHRLAVNIWDTGRVHVQGKGASHFAQLSVECTGRFFAQRAPAPAVAGSLRVPRPFPDPISQARLEVTSRASVNLCWVSTSVVPPPPSFCRVCSALFREVFWVSSVGVCGLLLLVSSRPHDGVVALLPSSIQRWSRHRHKRIRGIGSQASSQRGAKSCRLALASKAHPFLILARVSRWTKALRLKISTFPNFQAEIRGMASRRSVARHRSNAFFWS